MRWERLFADLEARLNAQERAELAAEVAERTVAERATLELAARVLARRGHRVAVRVRGGRVVTGTLADGAASWFLLVDGASQTLIPAAAVTLIEGLEGPAAVLSEIERRLRASTVLRALAEDRARVVLDLGEVRLPGVILAVGADHLDLGGDEGRVRVIPLDAIVAVDSR